MLIKQHKSGQATIVLIVVTMMTVLGVAVASSSQSRINLRDTVYSTQALQALSCAEGGADRALIDSRIANDQALSSPFTLSSSESPIYELEGCQGYDVTVSNYPTTNPGKVTVLNIPENATQEFNVSSFPPVVKTIKFKSNTPGVDPAFALYEYTGTPANPQVFRKMIYCDTGQGNPSPPPEGFAPSTYNSSGTIVLDDGTETTEGYCTHSFIIPANPVAIRIRPLYGDMLMQIENFNGSTGYQIVSKGTAGRVQRDVTVTRFYGQLPGLFDDSVVAGDEILAD